jgi:hypothetical protein
MDRICHDLYQGATFQYFRQPRDLHRSGESTNRTSGFAIGSTPIRGGKIFATNSSMADPATICDIDFSFFLPKGSKEITTQAGMLIVWWKTFQQSGFLRKNPGCSILESSAGILRIKGVEVGDTAENKIRSSMKKIKVEDLGKMQAYDLLASIPEEDPQGRGQRDLRDMEKKLSVKIVFDKSGGHVYLVGDAKKLEKKVFAMRNLLSHYHWRLSGTDALSCRNKAKFMMFEK